MEQHVQAGFVSFGDKRAAKTVEVFKTTVQHEYQAAVILDLLSGHFPMLKINFDLEDCDKILRVEGHNFVPHKIIDLLAARGYSCEALV